MASVDSSFGAYLETLDPRGELPHPDAVCGWPEEGTPGSSEFDGLTDDEIWARIKDDPRTLEMLEVAEDMSLLAG